MCYRGDQEGVATPAFPAGAATTLPRVRLRREPARLERSSRGLSTRTDLLFLPVRVDTDAHPAPRERRFAPCASYRRGRICSFFPSASIATKTPVTLNTSRSSDSLGCAAVTRRSMLRLVVPQRETRP